MSLCSDKLLKHNSGSDIATVCTYLVKNAAPNKPVQMVKYTINTCHGCQATCTLKHGPGLQATVNITHEEKILLS